MSLVSNHLSTRLNTYRDIANFSSIAGEKLFRNSPVFVIARQAFVSLNACLVFKEGRELVHRVQKENVLHCKTWSPLIANILNIIAVAASVFYAIGYINFPLFIIGCASQSIPYSTNFLKGSDYVPMLNKMGVFGASQDNQQAPSWLNPLQMVRKVEKALNAPSSEWLKDMNLLCQRYKKIIFLYNEYNSFVEQLRNPRNYNFYHKFAQGFVENRSKETAEIVFSENVLNLKKADDSLIERVAQEIRACLQTIKNTIASKDDIDTNISLSRRTLSTKIAEIQHEELAKIQKHIEDLRDADLLINFACFVGGIAYVSSLIRYYGSFFYENFLYLLFFAYSVYDFRKIDVLSRIEKFVELNKSLTELSEREIEGAVV